MDAQSILESARAAAGAGPAPRQDWTFLRRGDGGWEVIAGEEWTPQGLAAERGATAVYRLTQRGNHRRVEGWMGGQRCVLEEGQ